MLEELKTKFCSFLKGLGYNISDNNTYKEQFPWLMIRTGGYQFAFSRDINMVVITMTLDIFSTYNGEKEIIEIVENILNHIKDFQNENLNITAVSQYGMKILGDKETGPVRKHGVVSYRFILNEGSKEIEDELESTTGD